MNGNNLGFCSYCSNTALPFYTSTKLPTLFPMSRAWWPCLEDLLSLSQPQALHLAQKTSFPPNSCSTLSPNTLGSSTTPETGPRIPGALRPLRPLLFPVQGEQRSGKRLSASGICVNGDDCHSPEEEDRGKKNRAKNEEDQKGWCHLLQEKHSPLWYKYSCLEGSLKERILKILREVSYLKANLITTELRQFSSGF